MTSKVALFEGLVSTESGEPVGVALVGSVPHYVVPDAGFMRHIGAREIDSQVLDILHDQIDQHRELAVQAALDMIGKDDLFTKAMIDSSIDNMERLLDQGLPEEMRAWLGIVGFKVIVNYKGEVVRVEQPRQPIADE